ncbi:hypothetical protein [Devosia sp. A449]
MIEAINILLDRSLIAWSPIHLRPPKHGHIAVELAGQPSVIVWHDVGYGELSISVWWRFDYEAYCRRASPIANFATTLPAASRTRYPQFVGAAASVWLERKDGLFVQGTPALLFDVYTRKGVEKELSELPWEEPRGFKISGDYYL